MNRTRLGALALAAAIILLPTESWAQRYRVDGRWDGSRTWDGDWGGRSGFYFGYGSPYGLSFGYGRGYYPYYSGYYGYGYSPWYGNNYSYPTYDYGYRYNYGPSYSRYDMPSYSYDMPGYSYESGYPTDLGMMAPNEGMRVTARVRVPTADAHLWIEGQEMSTNGLNRGFISPALDSGQRYTYTFRAQWNDNGKKMDQTREVRVYPGDRITVDFTAPQKGSGAGAARESGYGPDGATPPSNQKATPPQPRTNTPPASPDRPRGNTSDRDQSRPPQ
jgi:uncharacterized protein (TIGR03000 family)